MMKMLNLLDPTNPENPMERKRRR